MSLTTCLKKAGDAIDPADKSAILDRARALRSEGKSPHEAAVQAVSEQLAAVRSLLGDAPAEPAVAAPAAPSGNTIFTDDMAAAARERLRKKIGRLQSGIDPETMMDGLILAGYHIEKGARTFAAFARAMLADMGEAVRPYLKSWYMAARYDPRLAGLAGEMSGAAEVEAFDIDAVQADNGTDDALDTDANLERNRSDAEAADSDVAPSVSDGAGAGARRGAAGTGSQARSQRSRPANDPGVPAGGATAGGERGDQRLDRDERTDRPSEFDAGTDFDQRGVDSGEQRAPSDAVATEQVARAAERGVTDAQKRQAQRAAESIAVQPGIDNIRATLPYLLPEQQEDVQKAEARLDKPDGYGMLFTNGTGTGKTFTGLGVIKRFARRGKTNQLILVPDAKIMADWIESAKALGLTVAPLSNTKDAGKGIVITTYANAGDNLALVRREWDLVTTDEAHQLMQGKDGEATRALATVRAITRHPDYAYTRHSMLHADEIEALRQLGEKITANTKAGTPEARAENTKLQARADALSKSLRQKQEAVESDVAAKQGAARTRLLALSATPFAYEYTVDWANGYLFDYPKVERTGYNVPNGWQQFFIEHFGYSMRVGKLTKPDARVDSGLMQRQFNGWLKKQGALSGRMLEVEADYDRKFVLVESAIGNRIDAALDWIAQQKDAERQADGKDKSQGMKLLSSAINDRLYGTDGHLVRRYLLEAIKAKESVSIIKQHLALGRKVVVFHDFKKGGARNPFSMDAVPQSVIDAGIGGDEIQATKARESQQFNEALARFKAKFPDLTSGDALSGLLSPIDRFTQEFPDVLLINGDEKPRDLLERYKRFNDDNQGPIVALVQSAKNKGWSGHDTTGKYPRVLFNLGLPTQPTMTIQQEGRIYRVGQASNAMMRYLNTGTTWERWAFAQTIARRASEAENLGQGEHARALLDAFITGYEESDAYPPGHEGEGTGGKQRDRALANVITEYDRAKSFYYGTQKKNSKTKAQEGADYFATPEPVGLKMVQWLNLRGGEDGLEPSAGHGAIARWLPDNVTRTAVEPSMQLRARLALSFDGKIVDSRFEDLNVVNKYDGIVMNPPFGTAGRTAIDHLAKAATHLRDGGRIVALIPTGPSADAKFDKWFYEAQDRPVKPLGTIDIDGKATPIYKGDKIESRASWAPTGTVTGWRDGNPLVKADAPEFRGAVSMVTGQSIKAVQPTGKRDEQYRPAADLHLVADIRLPTATFERAGTGVMTRIVVIEKQTDAARAPQQQGVRDLTNAADINELFDRLENMEVPPRRMTAEQEDAQAAAPPPVAARAEAKAEKKQAQAAGAEMAQQQGADIVEHVTAKGKTIRGVIRTDLTKEQAQSIDPYTWKKNGGFFIRLEHLAKLNERFPPFDQRGGDVAFSISEDAPTFDGEIAQQNGKTARGLPLFSVDSSDGRADTPARGIAPEPSQRHRDAVAELAEELTRDLGRAVVLDAVDAGSSPVRRGPGELETVSRVARDLFGREVVFVRFADKAIFNGVVWAKRPGLIYLNADSRMPLMAVLGHELLHQLRSQDPRLYHELNDRLTQLRTGEFRYRDALQARYANQGMQMPLQWLEELNADIVGDFFNDKQFWRDLAAKDRTLLERIADAVMRLLEDVSQWVMGTRPLGSAAYLKDIDGARAAVVDAMSAFSARSQFTSFDDGGKRFNPTNPDIRFSLTPDEERAFERAGLGGKRSLGTSIRLGFGRALAALRDSNELLAEARSGALDQFYGIRRAVKRYLGDLGIDQNPYITARLANGATSGVMRALLLHGQAQWAANGQHLEKKPGTKGLLAILEPLGKDPTDFFAWMIGNRAARLKREGRENNLSDADIAALQGRGKGREDLFKKVSAEYADFKRSVLDVAQAAGLIDPAGRAAWDHADYVPFYRQIDERAAFSPTGRKGLAGQSSGIRTLRGGESALNDPIENLLMNFSRLIDASLKNNAIGKTVRMLEGTGVVKKVGYDFKAEIVPKAQVRKLLIEAGTPEATLDAIPDEAFDGMAKMWALQAPSDPSVVRVMVGGKAKFYKVNDRLLLRALTSFVPFDFPGLNVMRFFKRLLTRTVTATPEFMLRNWVRDSLAAQAITPGFNPLKSVQGAIKSYNESGAAEAMLFAGVSFQSGNVQANDPAGTGKEIRRVLRAKGLPAATVDGIAGYVGDKVLRFAESYFDIGDAIENANREAVYEATMKTTKNKTAAAYESKDSMDFWLRGSWAGYQLLADVIPFLNARVQGLYRLGRSDPKRLALVGMMMAAASMLLAWANDGEDWYEELPDWDKDANWHFKIGERHFRLPKPFEIGVFFATIPERIGRQVKGLDTEDKTLSRLWANVRDQLAIDVVPQAVRPAMNAYFNWDSFRERPIENKGDENKLPRARYNASTSDTARVVAGAMGDTADNLGLSPKKLEYLVNGYLGTAGMYALTLSDMVVRKLEDAPQRPALRMDDYPVVRAFYREDPARATVFESDLYKLDREADKIAATIRSLRAEGKSAEAMKMMRENAGKVAIKPALDAATSRLGNLTKARDAIIMDRTLTPEQKREKLDELQLKRNALAKSVMQNPAVRQAQ
jgi:hypothetical protein